MRKQRIEELFQTMHHLKRVLHPKHGNTKLTQLTPSQCTLLFHIAEHPNSSTTSIAKALHITNGAVTQLVDGLAISGYVTRVTNTADRRASHIQLTNKALRRFQDIKATTVKRMTDICNTLSDDELETYIALTKKITEHGTKKSSE